MITSEQTKSFTPSLESLERSRIDEMAGIGFWVVGPLAIAITLQGLLSDWMLHPEAWSIVWVFARLGVVPVSILSMYILRSKWRYRFGDTAASFVGIYISTVLAFLVSQTGHINSKFWHAFVQLSIGVAIVPLKRKTYTTLILFILGTFLAATGALESSYNWGVFVDLHLINIVSYGTLIMLVYEIVNRARRAKYISQGVLENELMERQKRIDSLVASEMLVKEAELKIRLSQQVAHDIRSPLTAINVILNQRDLSSDPLQSLLRNAIKRVGSIAADLLNSTPSRANIYGAESYNLKSAFENLAKQKRYELNLNESQLVFFCDDSAINCTDSSVRDLERVLSNLINNAYESIDCGLPKIEIFLDKKDNHVCLEVRDNGRGIPGNLRSQIGLRGFTTKFSNGELDSGYGLGLSYAISVLSQRKGNLEFFDNPEGGTKVIAIWPYCSEKDI